MKFQSGPGLPVTDRVEHPKRFEGFFEDALAALPIRVLGRVAGQGGDNGKLPVGEESREVTILPSRQDRQVAADLHLAAER